MLIVDYTLDWARNMYRPKILRRLERLSTEETDDTITLRNDPDIYSMRGDLPRWVEAQRGISTTGTVIGTRSANMGDSQPAIMDESSSRFFSQFGNQLEIARDAMNIENQVCGLYITKDNVSTLCQGFVHRNLSAVFAISVLELSKPRCVILESENTLNALEDKWTGKFRARRPASENEYKDHAQFRVFYFINQEWDQIRELTYLAVSEDAMQFLSGHVGLLSVVKSAAPLQCTQEDLIGTIDKFLQKDVRKALMSRSFMIGRPAQRSRRHTAHDFVK